MGRSFRFLWLTLALTLFTTSAAWISLRHLERQAETTGFWRDFDKDAKARLLARQADGRPFDLILIGSSQAMGLDSALLTRRGLRTFNGGISGVTPADYASMVEAALPAAGGYVALTLSPAQLFLSPGCPVYPAWRDLDFLLRATPRLGWYCLGRRLRQTLTNMAAHGSALFSAAPNTIFAPCSRPPRRAELESLEPGICDDPRGVLALSGAARLVVYMGNGDALYPRADSWPEGSYPPASSPNSFDADTVALLRQLAETIRSGGKTPLVILLQQMIDYRYHPLAPGQSAELERLVGAPVLDPHPEPFPNGDYQTRTHLKPQAARRMTDAVLVSIRQWENRHLWTGP